MSEPVREATDAGTVALELSDGGLLVAAGGAPLAPPSPGYAVVDGHELLTGSAAHERARLSPRRTHHHFWEELDDTPLPRSFPRRWTSADLAHRHLSDLRRELAIAPERVIAVVASDSTRPRLERLVGVAVAAGWPIAGLVDAAVAAVVAAPELAAGVDRVGYLDLGLHRAVLAEVALGGAASRQRVLVARRAGLVELERVWARFFARRLVRATRFDPLHSAASEQRLYEAMAGWLERLVNAEGVVASLGPPGREHRVEVTRREVEVAAADLWRRIAELVPPELDGSGSPLLLSARAARLPGLTAALQAVAPAVVPLPPAAAAIGALAAADSILVSDGDPLFVVRLPVGNRGTT